MPDEVTDLLKVIPVHTHKKGQPYTTGRSNIVPTTGIWLFSTDRITTSQNFYGHLKVALLLLGFLPGGREDLADTSPMATLGTVANILRLKAFLAARDLTATMTFFWHGKPHTAYPGIPEELTTVLSLVPVHTEIDFDRDEAAAPSRRQHKIA